MSDQHPEHGVAEAAFVSEQEKAREQKELEYKRLVDVYHFELEKERVRSKRTPVGSLSPSESVAQTFRRDEIHKQLLDLGKQLGYGRDRVLADLVCREGNLGEYEIPEFGLLGHDEGKRCMWPITLQADPKSIRFSRFGFETAEEDPFFTKNDLERSFKEEREEDIRSLKEFYEKEGLDIKELENGDEEKEPNETEEDGVIITWRLKFDEVAIIFGAKFLDILDIGSSGVTMMPFDYLERERRAKMAARDYGVKMFVHEAYAPHDHTTFVGLAVPVERLDEIANRLRGDRDRFGVRPQDLDQEAVALDRKKILDHERKFWREDSTYGYEGYALRREEFLGDVLSQEEREDPETDRDVGIADDAFPEAEPPVRGARRRIDASKQSKKS